jgi:hypothetical protein
VSARLAASHGATETGGFLAVEICHTGEPTSSAVVATTCFLKGREIDRQGRRRAKRSEGDVNAMIMTVMVTKAEKQHDGVRATAVNR